ncbi:hypothetical protein CDL12_28517 [Handroanthus impetiginosus]|uniref:Phospholipase n=1 Tax=Handroanthus impetiginosus TaxID=429701 RepID=A0A2G9G1I9_9LAMI|nr:hypothetical protein CDL12_28517 [Handroanthus impetiginosus]
MEKSGVLSQVKRKRGRPKQIKQVGSNSEYDRFRQTVSCANASSSVQHSQRDNICPDNSLPQMVATADGNVQIRDLSTRPLAHDVPNVALMDTKSSENNKVISISQLETSFVVFDGYKVKDEIVPLLKAIFAKHGDIAKNSTFSMESRSCLLELVCSIYKRLEASKFMQLTSLELQTMLGQIQDLELVKVEVGWLHKRLLNISKARQLCNNVSTLKDVEARTKQEINEKKKAVKTCEKELESCMATVKKLQERINQEKDEVFAAMAFFDEIKVFSDGSLVKGLF